MCGICGIYNYSHGQPVDHEVLVRMADSIAHRGPDDEGYYVSGPLGFGFRRLSIIDLSGGHQPMSNESKRIWVVFNGEIYNFHELRAELEGYGYSFRTRSDTEVIVHGYARWGLDVFAHLNGMFGLAIWDEDRRRLVLSRDRMGIKLVYYLESEGSLFFGSEIRALQAATGGQEDIDPVSLYLFLKYRYTPSPRTIFKGVQKLPAGVALVVEEGKVSTYRWWRYAPQPVERGYRDQDAEERLLTLYSESVKRHLLSDVPIGLLLSGGVDSALLLKLMSLGGERFHTFTVGFGPEYSDDELADARATAEMLHSSHHEIRLDRTEFDRSLPSVIASLEEPIASASIVSMYHVSRLAAQHVKVAFIGQGPDELFGGYTRHLGVRYGHLWRALPPCSRSLAKRVLFALPRREAMKRGLFSLDIPNRLKRYQNVLSLEEESVIDSLFRPDLVPAGAGDEIPSSWEEIASLGANTDELGGLQFLEIRSTLPDELLMYADKLSMAHSLELRVPYLDKEIVEYVETLPQSLKIRRGSRKWLHKRVAASLVPEEILGRKKRAFASNIVDGWFKDSLSGQMSDIFQDRDSLMYAYLDEKGVARLLSEHRAGRHDRYKLLFSLVVFENWLRVRRGRIRS